ncbi:MAG: hypothetical protein L6R48_10860 [Planctomycetes bacterium]|nr:hypothetical protein [Planctomycetota bacterium]
MIGSLVNHRRERDPHPEFRKLVDAGVAVVAGDVAAHLAATDPHPQYLRDDQASPFGLSVLAMAAFAAGGLLIGAGASEPTVLAPAAGVLTSAGAAPSWSQSLDLDGPAIFGDDPGGAYNLRVMGGSRVRGNSGANTPFALFDGVAGGSTSLWDATDIMPGGVNTPRTMQRWIANGTGGYAYGAVWELCGGSTGSLYGDGREAYANTLTWRSRTSADGFAFASDAMTLHGDGWLEAKYFDALAGGQSIHLRAGTVDHCYLSFFPRTAAPGTRGGYIGFPAVGSTQLSFVNEAAGINSYFAAQGHVFGDATYGADPGGSEVIRTAGGVRFGHVIASRLYAASTNNLHLDGGIGGAGIYLNYYHGTGGVQFCNGSGSVVASINSGGDFSGAQVAAYTGAAVVGAVQFVAQGRIAGYGAGMGAYAQLSGSGVNTEMGRLVFDGEAAWSSADINTQRAYFSLKLNYKGVIYAPFVANSVGQITVNRIEPITIAGGMYGDANIILNAANSSSPAALGFHRPGASGAAIFHSGDGAGLLRLMRWAGGDYRIYHSGTDDVIHRLNEGSGYYQAPDWIQFTHTNEGVYWSHGAGAAIFKQADNYLFFRTSGAVAYVDQADSVRGYVYHDSGAGNFGLLNAAGTWMVRINGTTAYLDSSYLVIGADPGGGANLRSNGDFLFQKTVNNNEAVFRLQNPSAYSGYSYTSLEISGYYHVGRIVTAQNPTVEVSGSMYLQTKNTANSGWNPGLEINRFGQVIVNTAGDGSNPNFTVYGGSTAQGWVRISGGDYGIQAGTDYGGLVLRSNGMATVKVDGLGRLMCESSTWSSSNPALILSSRSSPGYCTMEMWGDTATQIQRPTFQLKTFWGNSTDASREGVVEMLVANYTGWVGLMQFRTADNSMTLWSDLMLRNASQAFYLGESTTDGSWRFVRSGNDLLMQRRIAGTWTTKSTITG